LVRRLNEARADYEVRSWQEKKFKSGVVPSSGNVFSDLGSFQRRRKTNEGSLAVAINQVIQGRSIANGRGAAPQCESTESFRFVQLQLEGFSVERLIEFPPLPWIVTWIS